LFTHVASYHADVVYANAIEGKRQTLDYSVIPWAVFTDPEIGHVGMTEQQAREAGHDVVTARFDFTDLDRAITAGEEHGMGKIVADAKSGRILGGHYLCYNAGEIVHELAIAMRAGMHVRDVGDTIHAYPTMAQGIRWTATNFRFD
jgi:pyruvate/2-oxoglutarate dehydrogenase complex dihydrolipoamide dehydrogenase (E3) component